MLFAATALVAVHAASSARRAASFDVTRDFDALAAVVGKHAAQLRAVHMTRVRAAALEPQAQPVSQVNQPMSHEQLRALARARHNGRTQ